VATAIFHLISCRSNSHSVDFNRLSLDFLISISPRTEASNLDTFSKRIFARCTLIS